MTKKRIYLFLEPKPFERYKDVFGSHRGGASYILHKLPALYYHALHNLSEELSEETLQKIISETEGRLTGKQTTLNPDHVAELVPKRHLVQVAALPYFQRVVLNLLILRRRITLPDTVPVDKAGRTHIDLDQNTIEFYQEVFGNSPRSFSIVVDNFWLWYDKTIKEAADVLQDKTMVLVMKKAMSGTPLPQGPFAGINLLKYTEMNFGLPHRLKDLPKNVSNKDVQNQLVRQLNSLPMFLVACLELRFYHYRSNKDGGVCLISPNVLPETASFFEEFFGKKVTGAGFACETFRALFEETLATGFIENTFSESDLRLLRSATNGTDLPKGPDATTNLFNLVKQKVDRLGGVGNVADLGLERLVNKLLELNPLQRVVLDVMLRYS